MLSSPDTLTGISQRLEAMIAQRRSESADLGPEAAQLIDAAAESVSGGKRLRGRFCVAGWRAVSAWRNPGESAPDAVLSAAAALEVFQAAALVHDDLIDNSDTRRGRPAAHRALQSRHQSAGWVGDADQFGRSAAILLGDLLVAWSDDILEDALDPLDPSIARAARRFYATMRHEVTVGQFLDIAEESAFHTAPDGEHAARALRIASYKSARYSIQQPLAIGGAIAGADADQAAALAAFGHPLGMAFQLRDDVLGVFGDQSVTGKPSGDDLREGKRTLLVAYSREALDPSARRLVDELIGDPGLSADQIAWLQRTIVDTGALDRVETAISSYAQDAERALNGAHLDHAAVSELRDLARAATVRSA